MNYNNISMSVGSLVPGKELLRPMYTAGGGGLAPWCQETFESLPA